MQVFLGLRDSIVVRRVRIKEKWNKWIVSDINTGKDLVEYAGHLVLFVS
jgi:hypothetical protein